MKKEILQRFISDSQDTFHDLKTNPKNPELYQKLKDE